MFGAVGDGVADDLAAIQACWDAAAAAKCPVHMEGLSYACAGALYTSSHLEVFGQGAVLYVTEWPSSGAFVSNVRPALADRVQSHIRIHDLVTDGSRLPAASGQNCNLGPDFAAGASNVRVVNCTARRIADGSGAGTGGGGFGVEQGGEDIQFVGCVAEDCYRGIRVAGVPGEHVSGASKGAAGVVIRDCVFRRCGTAIFCHSVGHGGDDQSDLAVFDVLVDGAYIEDCGHYPWRAFDFGAYPAISPQKAGVITLGGAQNICIRNVRVRMSPGYPDSFVDWQGRVGYPADGNFIGAGLSGPVGALIWGWGRNIVVEQMTLDGAADAVWKCARAVTFGDLATTPPTYSGPVVQIHVRGVRHVRQSGWGYVFDGCADLDNAQFGASVSVNMDAAPGLGVVGPAGTAALSNLAIAFEGAAGVVQAGRAVDWLTAGNIRPSACQARHWKGGYDVGGGYSPTGARAGQSYDPTSGILRTSQTGTAAKWHLALYNASGLVGGLQSSGASVAVRIRPDVIVSGGPGSPEGAVSANVGSLWLRTDGGTGTTLYVKQSGTGPTGWVAK